jgi:hypothetical protein
LVIYRPVSPGGPPLLIPGAASPSPVEIAGNSGQEVTTVVDGVVTRLAFAELEDRLVMFFVRTSEARIEELEPVFDHALGSVRLSEGIEGTPVPPGPRRRG